MAAFLLKPDDDFAIRFSLFVLPDIFVESKIIRNVAPVKYALVA